jgi:very-short-patch-repair endonuclease
MPRAKGPVHVTVRSGSGHRPREGLVVHRLRTLDAGSTTFVAAIRVTTPVRTLADLRPRLADELHDRAARRALDLGLISPDAVESDLALTRSELERMFLATCRRHKLPEPEVNVRLGRYEVDFLWRDARLVVELDGYEFHSTREAFERDRARDADLQSRSFRVLRFTWRQVRDSPKEVARTVRELLAAG